MKIAYSPHSAPAVLSRLSAISPLRSALVLAIALVSIFVLDHRTAEAPVQHLYYIPLIFAGLRFGAAGGLLTGIGSIGLYHVANIRFSPRAYHEADLLQMAVFIAVPLITAKLADDARRLRNLASTDDLTGLSNLRAFEVHLEELLGKSRTRAGSISMLVLDVDGLKSLNDTYGHLTGADAVRTVGRIIAALLPKGAAACRYGGDEFAIAVPCGASEAKHLGEALVQRVRHTAPMLDGSTMPSGTLSVSIGIASRVFENTECTAAQDTADGEALFRAADRALYMAKANGKGRTAIAE